MKSELQLMIQLYWWKSTMKIHSSSISTFITKFMFIFKKSRNKSYKYITSNIRYMDNKFIYILILVPNFFAYYLHFVGNYIYFSMHIFCVNLHATKNYMARWIKYSARKMLCNRIFFCKCFPRATRCFSVTCFMLSYNFQLIL